MSEKRTIRVTGKGNLKIRPDVTRITMTLEETYPEYEETLNHAAKSKEIITDLLANYGFKKEDIKTTNFRVDTEYESYNENGEYKQRFVGYSFQHVLRIEFDSDNIRLGKILYGLAHCEQHCEFRITYAVKDEEAAKNQLLGLAVKDAKAKASALAMAAEVKLKDILSIDYSWSRINFEVDPIEELAAYKCCEIPSNQYNMDIEPDDIDVSDAVTIIWEIEK